MSIIIRLKKNEYSEARKKALQEKKQIQFQKQIIESKTIFICGDNYKLKCPKCKTKIYTLKETVINMIQRRGSVEELNDTYICMKCRKNPIKKKTVKKTKKKTKKKIVKKTKKKIVKKIVKKTKKKIVKKTKKKK